MYTYPAKSRDLRFHWWVAITWKEKFVNYPITRDMEPVLFTWINFNSRM